SIKKSNATDYDIIIVDNASTDHSGQQLKEKYPSVILLQANKNLGFAGGNNLGLKYSIDNGYRYSFLLNNDTFVDADFLNPLVELIAANAVIGAIQPRIYYNHDRTILWN
ncbi:glycosyltransferase, partial [Enterococcus faecium]|uniref:glycosyltransferase n=1 Tax=Enterococcus faecium TaxID=1352 RepID=UPI003AB05C08